MKEYPRILKNILEILCQKYQNIYFLEYSYKFVYIGQYLVRFLVSILRDYDDVKNILKAEERKHIKETSQLLTLHTPCNNF